ncbi:hypothetical protein [Kribbella sp. HUAS MG21]|uniref:Uncharacterized protein n=1 Tax=Kribbella sp. HUAS MG21 TaxID=3160966 RepID=A0AAU7TPH0_9ACTN
MPTYYKRTWDEPLGAWGTSNWYFEVDADGWVLRQLEVYATGPTLRYDETHQEDEHGGRALIPLSGEEFAPYEITAADFEAAWTA